MKTVCFIIIVLSFTKIYSQPNCEAFRYFYKDTLKYEACKKAEQVEGHYQFSKAYQEILDESIKIDSTFAYAYTRKSVAYLKSGDFITWKKLIDKAVKFNPQEYLGHRGYIRFLCFRDYKDAIRDFKQLDSLVKLNIGFSLIANEHLIIAKALCYKSIGEKEKAIQIFEEYMNTEDYSVGLHDYLHLGILYLEQKYYDKALQAFLKQSVENELAENQFYLAMTYKALKLEPDYTKHLEEAKKLYLEGSKMFQTYIDPMHKIYLATIENELQIAYNMSTN